MRATVGVMTTADAPQVPADTLALPGGGRMPLLGFGTWQITGQQGVAATAAALEAGYRHLDTATVYHNEAQVGRALAESGLRREEVFVTTKCPGDREPGQALDTLRRSLELLGLEYVDLWLVHWPADGSVALWREVVTARDKGWARDVGVSNFPLGLVDEVTADCGVAPAVNQVEWSPYLFEPEVLHGHRERGVVLEGYSALRNGTLDDPTINAVAQRLGRTPAQVILRWHLQHGVVAIPKSATPERIRGNADVGGFELSADDMAAIDGLSRAG